MPLLLRTTRSVALSQDGAAVLDEVRQFLVQADALDRQFRERGRRRARLLGIGAIDTAAAALVPWAETYSLTCQSAQSPASTQGPVPRRPAAHASGLFQPDLAAAFGARRRARHLCANALVAFGLPRQPAVGGIALRKHGELHRARHVARRIDPYVDRLRAAAGKRQRSFDRLSKKS